MKRRGRSLSRAICYMILLALSIAVGMESVAGAETIAELEKKAQDCR